MNNNSNVIGRVSATITQKLTNSKFFKNTVSTFVAISMVLVALPFLSMAGFNPINLSEQKAEAGLVCPPGYFTDANTGCIQHLQKVTTCPDGSTAGGGNVCSTGQNKAWNCSSNIAGQVTVASDHGTNMCTSSANSGQFIQSSCVVQFSFSSTTPGQTFYNTSAHRTALGLQRMLNYTTEQVDTSIGTLNGQTANAQFCQPNACPSGSRIFIVQAKNIHFYGGSPTINIVCVNTAFIGETNDQSGPIFVLAGGNNGSGSFDEFNCGDYQAANPSSGFPPYLSDSTTAFTSFDGLSHAEVNWVCIRPNYVSSNTGCPASHPNDVGQPAPFVCRANNFTYDNSGAEFWVNDATTPGTGTCTPPTVAQAGGTATCTFPLSGAPTGATYTLGGLPPITATVGSGQSNPCTVSGSNLVCTGVPANNSQPIGVNTVSLSMGAGTASLTLTTPLTPAQVAALAVSCALAQTNSTTTCTFTLPVGYTLPAGTQITIGNGAAGGTCTAVGQLVTCTGVPTGTGTGNQPIGVVIGGVNTPSGETVGIATSPLLPSQVPALTVTCVPAGAYSTTTCTFTLPDGVSIPAGTQISIGNGGAGGVCTSVGQVVTCTGVPTGTGTGAQPISVIIGGVTTPTGETVTITKSPITPAIIPTLVPGLVVNCTAAEAYGTTTCTFTLPEGLNLPVGTQIKIGTGNAGGTCTAVGQLVTCTGVPTGENLGAQTISLVIGGVPTLIVGSTVNIKVQDRQVKTISISSNTNTSSANTNAKTETYPVKFANGDEAIVELLNAGDGTNGTCKALSGVAETKLNGKSYLEFAAACEMVKIKTWWTSLDAANAESYAFQKVNKNSGEEWPSFPASISTETKDGKTVITSVHTVSDNQAGDSNQATTNILDPYTLKLKDDMSDAKDMGITKVTKTVRTGGDQILKVSISAAIIALIGLAFKVSRKGQLKQLD